ncbi:arsenate-mycothiol transferase ArsC [Marinobacter adhaerens]|uniref:arsenate-mycothiol transferase ArsC n=1 Tax=Marinobacter adhaerens TaxID=1033846 RepID=UPI001C58A293|nr:low molecular weight phosphatase family protein [Marinobacter adhaerens]
MDGKVYERFGSRTGFARYLGYWLLALSGKYEKFTLDPPERSRRIVFICSGNICRSPLAEEYARKLGRETASCGFHCVEGYPADPRAKAFAESQGLSLDNHKTKNINHFEFRVSDFVVVMEPHHIGLFRQKFGENYALALAGNYCDRPNPYIHDPFNCCEEFFMRCEQRVVEAVRGICG